MSAMVQPNPSRPMRPCLDCSAPAASTRCATCSATEERRRRATRPTDLQRGYDYRWRKLSERARRLQPFCVDCGTADDLTTDHLIPLAKGGTRRPTMADVVVRCRSCNSRKGTALPTAEQLTLPPGLMPRTRNATQAAPQASGEIHNFSPAEEAP